MRATRREFALGLAGTCLLGCETAERPLWSADTHPRGYPTVRAVEHMAQKLRDATDGRLDIRIYAGGQLGSERDTLEITMFGGLDLNRVNLAPLNPIAPATLVPALPFLFRSIAHMRSAMDGAPGRRILESLEAHGLKGLCFYDSGARSFYNTKRPIVTPDDMAGLKIRVQNSDLYVALVEALGADATPMSFGEVYQALVQGVIDGAENNWPSYDTTRHFEAAPYYSTTEHVMAPEVLVMSMRRWRRLSDQDRTLVERSALESVPVMRKLWDARVNASRERLTANGITLTTITDKRAFQQRVTPVYDEYLNPELRSLADEIMAMESIEDIHDSVEPIEDTHDSVEPIEDTHDSAPVEDGND
ncbi:MAG: TRAP transporter substrate-binding protein [Pseudomonadota bacterium]